jgi:hypothetical protein
MNTPTTQQAVIAFYNRFHERVTTLAEELQSLKYEIEEAKNSFPYVHTSDSIGHWIPRGNEVQTIIELLKDIDVNEETMQHIITQAAPQTNSTKTQDLKPFVETICKSIVSSICLYVEDMPDSDFVESVYIDSERTIQFNINIEKILETIRFGYSDNFAYTFERECNRFAIEGTTESAAQNVILNFTHTTNII